MGTLMAGSYTVTDAEKLTRCVFDLLSGGGGICQEGR